MVIEGVSTSVRVRARVEPHAARGSHQGVLDDDDLLLFTDVSSATSRTDDEPVGAN